MKTSHSDEAQELVQLMRKRGIPVTRDNYLHLAYMGDIPKPWTREDEVELPPEIRDLTKFK